MDKKVKAISDEEFDKKFADIKAKFRQPQTADELYPNGYAVVQNNDGSPDMVIPTPAAPSNVDDMAKKEQDANIEDVANSIAEDMYPYPSHMKYAFGGKGLVDADRFKIVKGFKLGAQWQKQCDADTIAQLQATNLKLSKRVFELEKELDEQTLSFMDWMLLNSYEYSYTNKGWQNDFPDGMDPNSEEPTYHTTQQLIQIYKQSK